jgi:hypothetical protein
MSFITVLFAEYFDSQIMKDEMGQAAHVADMRNAQNVFIGNP